jgi:hypothetical protein
MVLSELVASNAPLFKEHLALRWVSLASWLLRQSVSEGWRRMSPVGQCLNVAVSDVTIPVNHSVLKKRHLVPFGLMNNLCFESLLLVSGKAIPQRQVHCLPAAANVALHQP